MGCGFENLPEDARNAILRRVPAIDLVLNCSLVCKRWFDTLSGRYFWLQKLESDGTIISEENRQLLLENEDYDLCLYILKGLTCGLLPFNRNLIRNPCGQESRKHWLYRERTGVGFEDDPRGSLLHGDGQIGSYEEEEEEEETETAEELRRRYPNENHPEVYRYTRHGFSIEQTPIGTEMIPEEAGVPTQHCFVTSFYNGVRTQLIDIAKYKMKEGVMELLKPTISYSQWVASRGCGCRAELSLLVTSGEWKMSPKTIHWDTSMSGVEGKKWYKMEGQVDTPFSIEWILYRSSGSDLVGWAGNYGSKTTACSLIIQI